MEKGGKAMNGTFVTLLRKDLRDLRLPLVLGTLWMVGCVVYVVAYEFKFPFRSAVARLYVTLLFYGIVASIFIAMKTSLGERTAKTAEFSGSLPMSPGKLAASRLLAGGLALVLPVFLAAVVLTPFLGMGIVEQVPPRSVGATGANFLDGHWVRVPDRASLAPSSALGLLWTLAVIETL